MPLLFLSLISRCEHIISEYFEEFSEILFKKSMIGMENSLSLIRKLFLPYLEFPQPSEL